MTKRRHRHDTWVKPRSHGTHLTPEEIASIKRAYIDRVDHYEVARRLHIPGHVLAPVKAVLKPFESARASRAAKATENSPKRPSAAPATDRG